MLEFSVCYSNCVCQCVLTKQLCSENDDISTPLGWKRKLLSRLQRSLVTLKEIFMKWKANTIKSCNFCS